MEKFAQQEEPMEEPSHEEEMSPNKEDGIMAKHLRTMGAAITFAAAGMAHAGSGEAPRGPAQGHIEAAQTASNEFAPTVAREKLPLAAFAAADELIRRHGKGKMPDEGSASDDARRDIGGLAFQYGVTPRQLVEAWRWRAFDAMKGK